MNHPHGPYGSCVLELPTDLVIDPVTTDRLVRQLAAAPASVAGVVAARVPLPAGSSTPGPRRMADGAAADRRGRRSGPRRRSPHRGSGPPAAGHRCHHRPRLGARGPSHAAPRPRRRRPPPRARAPRRPRCRRRGSITVPVATGRGLPRHRSRRSPGPRAAPRRAARRRRRTSPGRPDRRCRPAPPRALCTVGLDHRGPGAGRHRRPRSRRAGSGAGVVHPPRDHDRGHDRRPAPPGRGRGDRAGVVADRSCADPAAGPGRPLGRPGRAGPARQPAGGRTATGAPTGRLGGAGAARRRGRRRGGPRARTARQPVHPARARSWPSSRPTRRLARC